MHSARPLTRLWSPLIQLLTALGLEPTPLPTGAWSQRLRPLGQIRRISCLLRFRHCHHAPCAHAQLAQQQHWHEPTPAWAIHAVPIHGQRIMEHVCRRSHAGAGACCDDAALRASCVTRSYPGTEGLGVLLASAARVPWGGGHTARRNVEWGLNPRPSAMGLMLCRLSYRGIWPCL